MYKLVFSFALLLYCHFTYADIFSDAEPQKNIPTAMSMADYAGTYYYVEKEKSANPLIFTIKKDLSASTRRVDKKGKTHIFNCKKATIVGDLLIFKFPAKDQHTSFQLVLAGSKEGKTKKLMGTILIYHDNVLSKSDGMYFLNNH